MTPQPIHESVDALNRDQLVRLLCDHLTEDLALDPEGATTHGQRAKMILDRLPLLDTGAGVDPVIHAAFADIDSAVRRVGIRLSQLARGA